MDNDELLHILAIAGLASRSDDGDDYVFEVRFNGRTGKLVKVGEDHCDEFLHDLDNMTDAG